MLSDLLEVVALASLVAGVYVLLGLGFALLTVCPALMFIGYGIDDKAVNVALSRSLTKAGRRARATATTPGRALRRRRASRIARTA